VLPLGPIAFASPWALTALAALPALWLLLRMTPPAPRRLLFPAVRLLLGLRPRDETARRTPWWLIALRLALALALIFGAARPLVHQGGPAGGPGPLVLLIDDGWAAAPQWAEIIRTGTTLIDAARRDGRSVVLAPTAPLAEPSPPPVLRHAADAREALLAMQPKPWPVDRAAAVEQLRAATAGAGWSTGEVIWLSDGLQPAGATALPDLTAALQPLGPVSTVYLPASATLAHLLRRGAAAGDGREIVVERAVDGGDAAVSLTLHGNAGAAIGREAAVFAPGATTAQVRPAAPAEWLADLARVSIEGESSAGAVLLADAGWRRRPVGLVSEAAAGAERPLTGAFFYVERALQPFAEVRRGPIASLLARDLAVLVLADVGSLDAPTAADVRAWVEAGGVLLRFAGPSLLASARADDPLLPVTLRPTDRALGGSLSWTPGGRLAPFDAGGPLAGLEVPKDVTVHRQVLAEPGPTLGERTWARLDDGTPLITGTRLGHGFVVLVHTTANAEWSNLPLSGVFVAMLQRIVALAEGRVAGVTGAGPPLRTLATLDGWGVLGPPPPGAAAIAAGDFATARPGPKLPPGYYGAGDDRLALNLAAAVPALQPLPALPDGVRPAGYGELVERDLQPWLWGLALALALADFAASLAMRGLLRPRHRLATATATAALLLASLCLSAVASAAPAGADGQVVRDGSAAPAALAAQLAFVRSGDRAQDALSEAGLVGLTAVINRRTAADLGAPAAVDIETDELVFYPLLYWPLMGAAPELSPAAVRKVTGYMRQGGTILFDTRGQGGDLGRLARQLDLPELVPVDDEHVLRRAYYLLSELPGRWTGRPVWVEPASETVNDGVSAVIAGSHDWAGAWAVDAGRRPMLPVVPGGERQRELAYRFGVNVVMYVLTGNYKADQVHLPTILERLGR
jgi:hypothetical protein